jgi:hypothetical protein
VQFGDKDILALEITVDRSGGHARFFGDICHGGTVKAIFGNEFQGRLQDVFALI